MNIPRTNNHKNKCVYRPSRKNMRYKKLRKFIQLFVTKLHNFCLRHIHFQQRTIEVFNPNVFLVLYAIRCYYWITIIMYRYLLLSNYINVRYRHFEKGSAKNSLLTKSIKQPCAFSSPSLLPFDLTIFTPDAAFEEWLASNNSKRFGNLSPDESRSSVKQC